MILRPLIPPRALTEPIQARRPDSVGPNASGPRGPLTPVMLPMVIEVAVTPTSLAVLGPELAAGPVLPLGDAVAGPVTLPPAGAAAAEAASGVEPDATLLGAATPGVVGATSPSWPGRVGPVS